MDKKTIWVIGYHASSQNALDVIKSADEVFVRGNLASRWMNELGRQNYRALLFNLGEADALQEVLNLCQQSYKKGSSIVYITQTFPLAVDYFIKRLVQSLPEAEIKWEPGEDLSANSLVIRQKSAGAGLVTMDGLELVGKHHLPFSATQTTLLFYPGEGTGLEPVASLLSAVYSEDQHVKLLFEKANGKVEWNEMTIEQLKDVHTSVAAMLLSPRSEDGSLESFEEVIARLRAPDGCPWDRKQTHQSLRTYLLEETYEALSELDDNNMLGLKEELGDLMLQIVLHTQIAAENSEFNMAEVLESINRKIVRRHPHIFGDVEVEGVKGVVQNWEKLKEKERQDNGTSDTKGLLDGIPVSFPALAQAQSIQDRAARVGFDWKDIKPVMEKVLEEYEEVQTAPNNSERAKELGDLLFAVVNLVRWYHVDAESALRGANLKFRKRFAYIETKSREIDKPMQEMTLEEMDIYWNQAKEFDV